MTALFENQQIDANTYRVAVAPAGYVSPELLEADWHRMAKKLCGGEVYETALETGIDPVGSSVPNQINGYGLSPTESSPRAIAGRVTCG